MPRLHAALPDASFARCNHEAHVGVRELRRRAAEVKGMMLNTNVPGLLSDKVSRMQPFELSLPWLAAALAAQAIARRARSLPRRYLSIV
jgi:hypothetical protein